MPRQPVDVVQEFLASAFDLDQIERVVEELVAEDATYVSLNIDDPDLHRIMPWAGTKTGKRSYVENFRGVMTRWTNEAFAITDTITDGDSVALFGTFTHRSVKLGQAVTSAVAILAKVTDDKITHFQYMEDTFATARSFRSGGTWTIDADPEATEPIEV